MSTETMLVAKISQLKDKVEELEKENKTLKEMLYSISSQTRKL